MLNHKSTLILLAFIFLIYISCDRQEPELMLDTDFSQGVIIINEGNFMHSNGDFSHWLASEEILTNNIFSKQNGGSSAGDVIQSFAAVGDMGWFTANNSKSLVAVNLEDFSFAGRIENLDYPRYFAADSETRGYLTNGQSPGEVLKISLIDMQVESSLSVGERPENLLLTDDYIICCNGAWGQDSTLSIIRKSDFTLANEIVVGQGTTDIARDKSGNIWVLCQGLTEYDENWQIINESPSELVCLNSQTFEEILRIEIGKTGDGFQPVRLSASVKNDYVCVAEKDAVVKVNTATGKTEAIISGNFYGLEICPYSDNVYVFSDAGFQGNGYFAVYDSGGNPVTKAQETGVGPNGAFFLPPK